MQQLRPVLDERHRARLLLSRRPGQEEAPSIGRHVEPVRRARGGPAQRSTGRSESARGRPASSARQATQVDAGGGERAHLRPRHQRPPLLPRDDGWASPEGLPLPALRHLPAQSPGGGRGRGATGPDPSTASFSMCSSCLRSRSRGADGSASAADQPRAPSIPAIGAVAGDAWRRVRGGVEVEAHIMTQLSWHR